MGKGTCARCGRINCSINADKTVRYHLAVDPKDQEGNGSRRCLGVGSLPKEAEQAIADVLDEQGLDTEPMDDGPRCRVCRVCRKPYPLTANGRIRSHLVTDQPGPDGRQPGCPGGSDFPLGVDEPEATEDGETHMFTDLGNRTYGVHPGSRETCPEPVCEVWRRTHPDGVYCEQCDTDTHRCPGCGTDVPHGTVACDACSAPAEASGGTALDEVFTNGTNGRENGVYVHELAGAIDFSHPYNDGNGGQWVHWGRREDCTLPECQPVYNVYDCGHPLSQHRGGIPCGRQADSFQCEGCRKWLSDLGSTVPDVHEHTYDTADLPDDDGQDMVVMACTVCGEIQPCAPDEHRFVWGDDDNGHSGSVCTVCGQDEDCMVECACGRNWNSHDEMRVAGHGDMRCPTTEEGSEEGPCSSSPTRSASPTEPRTYPGPDASLSRPRGSAPAPSAGTATGSETRSSTSSPAGTSTPSAATAGPAADRSGDPCGPIRSASPTGPRTSLPQDLSASPRTGATAPSAKPHTSLKNGSGARPDPETSTVPASSAGTDEEHSSSLSGDAWRTPADLLEQMPEGILNILDSVPVCGTCGHEITPLVDRFGPDGRPEVIVWGCEQQHRCGPCGGSVSRCVPHVEFAVLGQGDQFKHNGVWMEVTGLGAGEVTATVLDKGPYRGRSGTIRYADGGRTEVRRKEACEQTRSSTARPSSPGRSSTPGTTASAQPPSVSVTDSSTKATSSGPSGTATTPTATASKRRTDQMATETPAKPDAFDNGSKPAVKEFDGYGRYILPDPTGTRKASQKYTRATTFAKSISDTYALSMWSQRMVIKGMMLREDLRAMAVGLHERTDKDKLNGLAEQAKDAAGNKVSANLGTAIHGFTEDVDNGKPLEKVPEDYRAMVDAYTKALEAQGLKILPGMIERKTAVPQYGVAGKFDRVYLVTKAITVTLPSKKTAVLKPGDLVVGDVKTGRDLDYGWGEISIQLTLYAHGVNVSGVFNEGTRSWDAVDGKVREDVGIVLHMPVQREEDAPLCTLYALDLEEGWKAAELCHAVREWRKNRNLATALEVVEEVPDSPAKLLEDEPAPGQALVAALERETAGAGTVADRLPAEAVTVRPPTWEERFRAVTTRQEASDVYQEALRHLQAIGGPARLNALVKIAQDKLRTLVELGG